MRAKNQRHLVDETWLQTENDAKVGQTQVGVGSGNRGRDSTQKRSICSDVVNNRAWEKWEGLKTKDTVDNERGGSDAILKHSDCSPWVGNKIPEGGKMYELWPRPYLVSKKTSLLARVIWNDAKFSHF